MERITKRELRTALRLETDAEVATFYGISASAVSQWAEDEPIPELRQLQAEVRRPELFTPEAIHRLRSGAANDRGAAPTSPGDMSEAA